jgi:hypothetical protein
MGGWAASRAQIIVGFLDEVLKSLKAGTAVPTQL